MTHLTAQRHDWTLAAIAMFKKLTEAKQSRICLANLRDDLLAMQSETDLELLFEYAYCANSPTILEMVASVMKERDLLLHIETLLRMALWPVTFDDEHLVLPADALNELVGIEPADENQIVLALLACSAQPAAFCRLLTMCPDTRLDRRDIDAIASVCYTPGMVSAVKYSWIELVCPMWWVDASIPPHRRYTADAIDNLILCAKLRYVNGCAQVSHLQTSTTSYWVEPPLYSCQDEDSTELPEGPHQPKLHYAMNQFVREAEPSIDKPFKPVKLCTNPAHMMCRHLIKK